MQDLTLNRHRSLDWTVARLTNTWDEYMENEEQRLLTLPLNDLEHELLCSEAIVETGTYPGTIQQDQAYLDMVRRVVVERTILDDNGE